MGRDQPPASPREYARLAASAVAAPAARGDARKSSQDDPRGPASGSVTDGPECGSTVITGPSPYRIATDANPTVDFPLKLPISRMTPCAGAHAATRARKRASRSVSMPGVARTRAHASSIAAARFADEG